MKIIVWLAKKFIIGALTLYLFNVVGDFFDMVVPLNYITVFLTGTLGVPGFILVYVLSKIVLV